MDEFTAGAAIAPEFNTACELEGWSVFQVIVAELVVMPTAETELITASGLEPADQASTVIEYGGSERPVAALKLASVCVVMLTLAASSLVSDNEADVSRRIVTNPNGAFVPVKVTGKLEVRWRLNTTSDRCDPLEKAKDCKWCALLSATVLTSG